MFDDTVTDVGWDAAALDARRDLWSRELTDGERRLLWSDALSERWTDADRVRKALHAFVLESSRSIGFARLRKLADPAGLGEGAATAGLSFILRDWGEIVPQNSRGELTQVLHDRDGDGATELGFHCDACDLLVLLCLRPAAHGGGETRLASARRVHDVIERERPAAIEPLREPWVFDRTERGGRIDVTPIFFTQPDGLLGCHYQPRTVRASAGRLSARQREALDFLDEVLYRPETAFGLRLAAGDLLVIRNSRALHGRSPYTDEPGPRSRRMLRVWLSEREAS